MANDQSAKVILVGGAPGAGKTTLGGALAARLGIRSLTIDDLIIGAQAVTTPETHPDLHITGTVSYLDYFTNSPLEKLKADATSQHTAAWPIIERAIRKHATFGPGIVIDGWHLRPGRVSQLNPQNVRSVWLVTLPSVLEARERNNQGWLQGSSDPDRMLSNFLARSLWYNDLIEKEVRELGMNVVIQNGTTTVDQLCTSALVAIKGDAAAF